MCSFCILAWHVQQRNILHGYTAASTGSGLCGGTRLRADEEDAAGEETGTVEGEGANRDLVDVRSCPQAAKISRPRGQRTVANTPTNKLQITESERVDMCVVNGQYHCR